LAIYYARSITVADVVQVLQRLFAHRSAPEYVKSDNGPEFIAQRVTTWLGGQRVDTILLTLEVRGRTGITRALTWSFAMAACITGCLHRSKKLGASFTNGERSTTTTDRMAHCLG
jgi:hypothetical protein